MFNFPEIEEKILKYWQENNIFQKSLDKEAPHGDYVFYDGPPFATGTPHYGHIVASLMKDIVPRYWTMKGFHVERKWGWDCHGLPIENIVEQELGTKSKKDIEKIGIAKFNETCRSKVLMYADEWRKVVDRLGRWVDMDNDYKTMDKDYMESIWWVFQQLWDKGLIYESYKSMHVCPRCETTLSQSEVAEGYKDVKDLSVTVKFKIKNQKSKIKNKENLLNIIGDVYVLAWTTTPWTLPGNVALAVGEDIDYVKIKDAYIEGLGKKLESSDTPQPSEKVENYYILAKKRFEEVKDKFKNTNPIIIEEFKGKDLVGLEYEPLFPYYQDKNLKNKDNLYTIQTADFVTTEDGTGVVHIAPAFGEDDMNLGKEKNLPFIQHVGMDGRFANEVTDFAGLEVKPKHDPTATDVAIIKYLAAKNLLFSKEKYEHSYPHCWRCDSPLLNYATSSWFVKVTDIKEKALATAKNINWVPGHIKEGRFGQWLEGARDWSISRQRFWGSVLPIWVCDKCGEKKVFGSIDELKESSGTEIDDLHKHVVDQVVFDCPKCSQGTMKRIPDVLDCWFESGAMPYAQMHYPFENKEKFETNFPAEFIAEGVDQTRAWFYYMHILSNAIMGKEAYKNVIVNGIALAEDGKKMSKKLRNYPDPMEMINKYGADAVRYYLCSSPIMKADNLNFSEKDLAEQSRFLNTLINVITFYQMFSEGLEVGCLEDQDLTNILDQWINSKLNLLIQNVTKKMDNYDLHAIREFPIFIDELSTWYVRRSRDRFKGQDETDKLKALKTLRRVILNLNRLMAPFVPFITEQIYQDMQGRGESVHLKSWPVIKDDALGAVEQGILDSMDITRKVVELGLAKRAEVGIKVRQPLKKLEIRNKKLGEEYLELVKDEVNTKEVVCLEGEGDLSVELDTEIDDGLKEEGTLRELIRTINSIRKNQNLTINDHVNLEYSCADEHINLVIEKFAADLKRQVLADEIVKVDGILETVKVNGVECGFKLTEITQIT